MKDLLIQCKTGGLRDMLYNSEREVQDAFPNYEFFEGKMEEYKILVGRKRDGLADMVVCYSDRLKGWFVAESERVKADLKNKMEEGLYTLREHIRVFD